MSSKTSYYKDESWPLLSDNNYYPGLDMANYPRTPYPYPLPAPRDDRLHGPDANNFVWVSRPSLESPDPEDLALTPQHSPDVEATWAHTSQPNLAQMHPEWPGEPLRYPGYNVESSMFSPSEASNGTQLDTVQADGDRYSPPPPHEVPFDDAQLLMHLSAVKSPESAPPTLAPIDPLPSISSAPIPGAFFPPNPPSFLPPLQMYRQKQADAAGTKRPGSAEHISSRAKVQRRQPPPELDLRPTLVSHHHWAPSPVSPHRQFNRILSERQTEDGILYKVTWRPSWVHAARIQDVEKVRSAQIDRFGRDWDVEGLADL